jgi:hypothetical protein
MILDLRYRSRTTELTNAETIEVFGMYIFDWFNKYRGELRGFYIYFFLITLNQKI